MIEGFAGDLPEAAALKVVFSETMVRFAAADGAAADAPREIASPA